MENSDCREKYQSLKVNMIIGFILVFSCACTSPLQFEYRCELALTALRI